MNKNFKTILLTETVYYKFIKEHKYLKKMSNNPKWSMQDTLKQLLLI
jgi:hypothetical protein